MPQRRAAALAAAAFTVAFIAGAVALGEILGAFGDPDDVFVDHYASPGQRAADITGGSLLVVAGVALLALAAALPPLLGQRHAATIAVQSLTGAALLLMVSAALLAAAPLSISFGGMFGDDGQFAGGHAAVLPQAGTVVLLVAAYPLAALALVAVGLAARSEALLPPWHFWFTLVCAAAMLLAIFFLPLVALPLWSSVTAILLWRTPPGAS